MNIEKLDGWIYITDIKNRKEIAKDITGKYLFFHQDQQALIDIAKEEIENNGFKIAKVSLFSDGEHVLCLYWQNDQRKHELKDKYRNREDVKYRYWKSDEDTRCGKYSQHYHRAG